MLFFWVYKLRGTLDYLRFWINLKWFHVLGIGFSLVSILDYIGLVMETRILSGALFIWTVVSLVKDISKSNELESSITVMETDLSLFSWERLRKCGYEVVTFAGQLAIYDKAVNSLICQGVLDKVTLHVEQRPYQLEGMVRNIAPYVLRRHFRSGKLLFNSKKVRLVSDVNERDLEEPRPIIIQPTSYFDSLCTNEMASYEFCDKRDNRVMLRGIELFLDEHRCPLRLEASRCSNHIGVSTLGITADRRIPITLQSDFSAQLPLKMAPTGSGSVEWMDVPRGQGYKFANLISIAMERELLEECGVSKQVIGGTRLIGYARNMSRGGKPEFFGLTLMNCEYSALRLRKQEKPFLQDHDCRQLPNDDPRVVASWLNNLLDDATFCSKMGLPLYLALLFFKEYAEILVEQGKRSLVAELASGAR